MKRLSLLCDQGEIMDCLESGRYNPIRSHGYAIFRIAKELGVDLEDFCLRSDKSLDSIELNSLTSITPLLKHDPDAEHIGIIVNYRITEENSSTLNEFLGKVDKVVYYLSDLEFTDPVVEEPMLLSNLNNIHDLYRKLFLVITGLRNQEILLRKVLKGVHVVFLPQMINDNLALFRYTSGPTHDAVLINNSRGYYDLVRKLVDSGLKVLNLTPFKEAEINLNGVTNLGISRGERIEDLVAKVAKASYYIGTNTFIGSDIRHASPDYATFSITSKLFEAYYAGRVAISGCRTPEQMIEIIKSDKYFETKRSYDEFLVDNYSMKSDLVRANFYRIVSIINYELSRI